MGPSPKGKAKAAPGKAGKETAINAGDLGYYCTPNDSWLVAKVKAAYAGPKGVPLCDVEVVRTREDKSALSLGALTGLPTSEFERMEIDDDPMDGRPPEDDIFNLKVIQPWTIMHEIRQRYWTGKYFTSIGPIMVSVNPYCTNLPLYTNNLKISYLKNECLQTPHLWGVAERVYQAVMKHGNQCVLVSGESGAGKTFSIRMVTEYLAQTSTYHAVKEEQSDAAMVAFLQPKVGTILEALGNAKTRRNKDSSRFAKFAKLQFNAKGYLAGCSTECHLLEVSRVAKHEKGERSFHIFYQMYDAYKEKYKLDRCAKWLFQGSNEKEWTKDPDGQAFAAAQHKEVQTALKALTFEEEEITQIYDTFAGVMHLMNLKFDADGKTGSKVAPKDKEWLEYVAKLWGVPMKELHEKLANHTRSVSGEFVTSPLTSSEANTKREALCKKVYQGVFDWVTQRLNEICDGGHEVWIGMLDIFGFECFNVNTFEQFCINLANEKLQNYYSQTTADLLDLYQREGIEPPPGLANQIADNGPNVMMMEKIVAVLDDLCSNPKAHPTDEDLLGMIMDMSSDPKGKDKRSEQPIIGRPGPKEEQGSFSIKHYADPKPVFYTVAQFLQKNSSKLHGDILKVLSASSSKVVTQMPCVLQAMTTPKKGSKSSMEKPLAGTFSRDMVRLLSNMSSEAGVGNLHWIRCIKPNMKEQPNTFEGELTMKQLECVLPLLEIARVSQDVWMEFSSFASKFGLLVKDKFKGQSKASIPAEARIEAIFKFLEAAKPKSGSRFKAGKDMQMGRTQICMVREAFDFLESARLRQVCGFVLLAGARFAGKARRIVRIKRGVAIMEETVEKESETRRNILEMEREDRKAITDEAKEAMERANAAERARVAIIEEKVEEETNKRHAISQSERDARKVLDDEAADSLNRAMKIEKERKAREEALRREEERKRKEEEDRKAREAELQRREEEVTRKLTAEWELKEGQWSVKEEDHLAEIARLKAEVASLKDEIDKLEEESGAKIKALEGEYAQLKGTLDKMSREGESQDVMIQELEAEKARLEREKERLIRENEAAVEEMEESMAQQKARLERESERAVQEGDSKAQELMLELEKEKSKSQAEQKKFEAEREKVQKEKERLMQNEADEKKKASQELARVQKLKEEAEARIAEEKAQVEKVEESMKEQKTKMREKQSEYDLLYDEMQDLQGKLKKSEAKLHEAIQVHEAEKSRTESDLRRLKEKAQQESKEDKEALWAEMEEEKQREMEALRSEMEEDRARLRRELEDDREKLKAELESQLNELRSELETLAKIREKETKTYLEAEERWEDEMKERERRWQRERDAMKNSLGDDAEEEKARAMRELELRLRDELACQFEDTLDSMRAEHEKSRDEDRERVKDIMRKDRDMAKKLVEEKMEAQLELERDRWAREKEQLKWTHAKEVEQFKFEAESDREQLYREVGRERDQLRIEVETLNRNLEEAQELVKQANNSGHGDAAKARDDAIKELERATMERDCKDKIQKAQAEAERAKAICKEETRLEVERVMNHWAEDKKIMKVEAENEIERVKWEWEQDKAKWEKAVEDARREALEQKSKLDKEWDKSKAELNRELEGAKRQCRRELEDKKRAMDREIEDMRLQREEEKAAEAQLRELWKEEERAKIRKELEASLKMEDVKSKGKMGCPNCCFGDDGLLTDRTMPANRSKRSAMASMAMESVPSFIEARTVDPIRLQRSLPQSHSESCCLSCCRCDCH